MEETGSNDTGGGKLDYLSPLGFAILVANKPHVALASLFFWLILELVFPTVPALHVLLVGAYAICMVPLAHFIIFGKKRLDAENDAKRKVPYVGDLLFLGNRTKSENYGVESGKISFLVALAVAALNFFSMMLDSAKMIGFVLKPG